MRVIWWWCDTIYLGSIKTLSTPKLTDICLMCLKYTVLFARIYQYIYFSTIKYDIQVHLIYMYIHFTFGVKKIEMLYFCTGFTQLNCGHCIVLLTTYMDNMPFNAADDGGLKNKHLSHPQCNK